MSRPILTLPTIWCSECRSTRDKAGSIQVPIGKFHYRNVCASCGSRWLEEIIKDKYAEDMAEQRKEVAESRERIGRMAE